MFFNFPSAISSVTEKMKTNGYVVRTEKWQGVDISQLPGSAMVELLHESLSVNMSTTYYEFYRDEIKPNLPWADDHFQERVCGYPLNPGTEWANWPWGESAKDHLDLNGVQFNHNYMERYWPKYAGKAPPSTSVADYYISPDELNTHKGIRLEYGDLFDMVRMLAHEPGTRQAYLPIWFPEDTGKTSGRKPCTLGYHFIQRHNRLHVTYYIRSCDFFRHFRDDIYLTVRLLFWVLQHCRGHNPEFWDNVSPGIFNMHITSLHMFIGDYQKMFKQNPRW